MLAGRVVEDGAVSRDTRDKVCTEERQVTFASSYTQYCVF